MAFTANLPNALTILRLMLAPVLALVFIGAGAEGEATLALVVFVAASMTDFFDGRLARRGHQVTAFGRFMDPVADKILAITALVCLAALGRIGVWIVALILGRELAVTALRVVASRGGVEIPVKYAGKVKTTMQFAMVCALIAAHPAPWWVEAWVYATVAVTVLTGIDYLRLWWVRYGRLARSGWRESFRRWVIGLPITPNQISLTGLVFNALAAVLLWQQSFLLAGLAFIVGSVMDTLDGRYSRMSGKGTPFGAFLDSTLDRMEEGVVLAAAAVYFASGGRTWAVAVTVMAVLFSLMVSYTRARAESLGVQCKDGLATRPVRVIVLSAGLVFMPLTIQALTAAVCVLAVMTLLTTIQRMAIVRRHLNAGR